MPETSDAHKHLTAQTDHDETIWEAIADSTNSDSFGKLAGTHFRLLDKDNNGKVSRAEAASSHNDDDKAKILLGLVISDQFSNLANLSNDEWGWETEVTRKDLETFSHLERSDPGNKLVQQVLETLKKTKQFIAAPCFRPTPDLEKSQSGLAANDLKRLAEKHFASFDEDNDGLIDIRELKDAWITGANETSEHELVRRTLLRHFTAIAKLSNDQRGFESKISRQDLDAVDRLAGSHPQHELIQQLDQSLDLQQQQLMVEVARFLARRFSDIDADGWSELSKEELSAYADNVSKPERERQIASFIADNYDTFRDLYAPSFISGLLGLAPSRDNPTIDGNDVRVLSEAIGRISPRRVACNGRVITYGGMGSNKSDGYIEQQASALQMLDWNKLRR